LRNGAARTGRGGPVAEPERGVGGAEHVRRPDADAGDAPAVVYDAHAARVGRSADAAGAQAVFGGEGPEAGEAAHGPAGTEAADHGRALLLGEGLVEVAFNDDELHRAAPWRRGGRCRGSG